MSVSPPPTAYAPAPPVPPSVLDALVRRALAEDVGPGDPTTTATVPATARARGTITQKAAGVVYGLAVAEATFRALDPEVACRRLTAEGLWREHGGPVLEVDGRARALLTAERTALNFLGRLSGVATLSARYARALEGLPTRLLDTRKTTPGLRALEKAAVAAGGGSNHRAGLYDAILIKENHVAAAGGIAAAIAAARARHPELADTLEVECRSPAEVQEALDAGAPRVLLDNMTTDEVRAAVTQVAGRAITESSGNVTLRTLRARAETGVDWISVGALTHSAPALDLSLILEHE